MKKTTITMLCLAACFAAADTKITWLADVTADRAETVTGVQSNQIRDAAAHIVRADNPHGVTAAQIGALTAELDPVANAALVVHTNRADNPHNVTAVQIGALTAELDPVANAALVVHTNRIDNPHNVTAVQIGALTSETDTAALAALAAYAAYWPRNATASSWFTFTTNSGAITITGYNIAGGVDVVIPDYINGLPVTEIGANAFSGSGVTSIGGAGNVVTVGEAAFNYCTSLTSASLPQARTLGDYAFSACQSLASVLLPQVLAVGDYAFANCSLLASVLLPQVQTLGDYAFDFCGGLTSLYFDNDAPTIGAQIFAGITPNQVTIYVTNPQATGWGATFGGMPDMPVVRLPLYADAIYQAGELVATEAHVAQAIAAIPGIVYSNSVSELTIYTNASGAATSWWQVASGVTNSGSFASGTPGAITNGQSGVTLGSTSFDVASGDMVFFKKSGVIKAQIDSDGNLYVNDFQSTGNYWAMAKSSLRVRKDWSLGWSNGNSYVPVDVTLSRMEDGVLQIGTNGTPNNAGALSLGQIKLGPTISGKQAHIFTDGTNCFFVNVNSVTNALTTN